MSKTLEIGQVIYTYKQPKVCCVSLERVVWWDEIGGFFYLSTRKGINGSVVRVTLTYCPNCGTSLVYNKPSGNKGAP